AFEAVWKDHAGQGKVSINRNDTSISKSKQLESAIPPSKIATLSSGEFVGMVADDLDQKIALKIFHNAIQNDHTSLNEQSKSYRPIPSIRKVTEQEIQDNYMQVKLDVANIISNEMDKL